MLALEDLHQRNIVLRGTKPETVVMGADGYAREAQERGRSTPLAGGHAGVRAARCVGEVAARSRHGRRSVGVQCDDLRAHCEVRTHLTFGLC